MSQGKLPADGQGDVSAMASLNVDQGTGALWPGYFREFTYSSRSKIYVWLCSGRMVFNVDASARSSQSQALLGSGRSEVRTVRNPALRYPYFDPGTQMLYIAGKGDSNVRYFEARTVLHETASDPRPKQRSHHLLLLWKVASRSLLCFSNRA